MPYYSQPDHIPSLLEALNNQTVDQLKALAGLLPTGKMPTRKAELISHVQQHLQGKGLKQIWNQCDRLQQAVIAEVVHSDSDRYQEARFVSKYGQKPIWGTGNSYSYRKYSAFQP